jgi:tol-pal system protein YbgF
MKSIRVYTLPILLAVIILPSAAAAQSKEQREKIDRMATQVEDLKTELVLLQRQTQSMQDTFNKTMGELNTLIVQMSDNISTIRRATESVSTRGGDVVSQVSSMGERITATNDRMERLSEQFAQLKKLIENLPKAPVLGNYDPGNPDQLFAAATGDYFRGNFDLALSEFRQYVETYPSSEMADNAQYFIGEILVAQNKKSDALAAFEKVKTVNPSGDKTAPALYKRAMVLIEMGQREEAVVQLLVLFKDYSKTKEGELAFQKLQEIAPESISQPTSTTPPRRPPPVRKP